MPPEHPFKQALEGAAFDFTPRPEPIAGDLRMSWGIAILILILASSHGKKASFQKLQFLAHAVRVAEGRSDVRSMLRGEIETSDVSVRIEPWLNRAVSYAHGLKLVNVSRGKSVALTDKGRIIADALFGNKDIFVDETSFLSEVTSKLTEAKLTRIWRMERLL